MYTISQATIYYVDIVIGIQLYIYINVVINTITVTLYLLLSDNYCVGLADGGYAYEDDCAWYYECDAGATSFLKCSDGLLYSVNIRDCVLPSSMDGDYLCLRCSEYETDGEWGC